MDYKLTLIELKEPRALIQISYPDESTELVWVGNLPLRGTAGEFVTAAKTYITNMLSARVADQAAKDAIKASTAVANLVGQSTTVTI